MIAIIPARLWIGNSGDLDSPPEILNAGVRAVVQLSREELLPTLPRELVVCRFPLLDGEGNDSVMLRLAIGCVADLLKNRIPTLVCCSGGMSRSPTIACAAIAAVESRSIDDVVRSVMTEGPIDVSPALWNDVVALGDC